MSAGTGAGGSVQGVAARAPRDEIDPGVGLANLGRLVSCSVGLLAIAAGVVHLSAAADHTNLPVMMAAFICTACAQVLLGGLLVARRPSKPLLLAGAALMLGSLFAWFVSRTVGVPFLPGGHMEPIGFKDGVVKVLELGSVAGLLLLTSREIHSVSLPSTRLATRALGGLGAGVFALSVPALVLGGGDHHSASELAGAHGHSNGGEAVAGHGDGAHGDAAHSHAGGGGALHADAGHAGDQGHEHAPGGHRDGHPHADGGLAAEGPGHGHDGSGSHGHGAGAGLLLASDHHGGGLGHPTGNSHAGHMSGPAGPGGSGGHGAHGGRGHGGRADGRSDHPRHGGPGNGDRGHGDRGHGDSHHAAGHAQHGRPSPGVVRSSCERRPGAYTCLAGPFRVRRGDLLERVTGIAAPSEAGYVTSARATLVDRRGAPIPQDTVRMHHVVYLNPFERDMTCRSYDGFFPPFERIFASGNERTPLELPSGYGYYWSNRVPQPFTQSAPMWLLVASLDGLKRAPDTFVRIDMEFVPRSEASPAMTEVQPVWLDVRNCSSVPTYDVEAERRDGVDEERWSYRMPEAGRFVFLGGHLHDGGLSLQLDNATRGEEIFTSVASYDGEVGASSLTAMSTFSGDPGVRIGRGDRLRLTAAYDSTEPRHGAMGIMLGALAGARGTTPRAQRDPLARALAAFDPSVHELRRPRPAGSGRAALGAKGL